MPGELAVARVPSRWRELRPEIDQAVARQLLLAKGLRNREDFRLARERAARLEIPECPPRRHFWKPGDARVFAQDDLRIARADDEQIERERVGGRRGERAVGAGEVEGAVRLVDEQAPSGIGADEPLDRRTRAVDGEAIAVRLGRHLSVAHPIGGSAAVEARAALAESEQRSAAHQKRQPRRHGVERESLHGLAARRLDVNRWRRPALSRVSDDEITRPNTRKRFLRPRIVRAACRIRPAPARRSWRSARGPRSESAAP